MAGGVIRINNPDDEVFLRRACAENGAAQNRASFTPQGGFRSSLLRVEWIHANTAGFCVRQFAPLKGPPDAFKLYSIRTDDADFRNRGSGVRQHDSDRK